LFLAELALNNKDIQIYGVDNWKDILKKTDKRLKEKAIEYVKLSHADATSLPFEDSYFDVVVCINVLYNLESMDTVRKILSEIGRVCKKGGRVIFDIRNSLNPLLHLKYKLAKYYDETAKDLPLRTYRLRNIIFNLRQHNFEVVQVIPLGFPKNSLAPIFVAEARKK